MSRAFVTFTDATLDAAADVLDAPRGYLHMATAIVKITRARGLDPERHRMNIRTKRKTLTVSHAGEGVYVATLTDDETVPPLRAALVALEPHTAPEAP